MSDSDRDDSAEAKDDSTKTPRFETDKMLNPDVGHIDDADAQLEQSRDDVEKASNFADDALERSEPDSPAT